MRKYYDRICIRKEKLFWDCWETSQADGRIPRCHTLVHLRYRKMVPSSVWTPNCWMNAIRMRIIMAIGSTMRSRMIECSQHIPTTT